MADNTKKSYVEYLTNTEVEMFIKALNFGIFQDINKKGEKCIFRIQGENNDNVICCCCYLKDDKADIKVRSYADVIADIQNYEKQKGILFSNPELNTKGFENLKFEDSVKSCMSNALHYTYHSIKKSFVLVFKDFSLFQPKLFAYEMHGLKIKFNEKCDQLKREHPHTFVKPKVSFEKMWKESNKTLTKLYQEYMKNKFGKEYEEDLKKFNAKEKKNKTNKTTNKSKSTKKEKTL